MNRHLIRVVLRCGPVIFVTGAASGDVPPHPSPGLWQETGATTHYDPAGRPVAFDGSIVRRTSGRHCMSGREAASFYANPLPTCRFDLRREGKDTSQATILCPASGIRFDVANRITPNMIDTHSVQRGPDGARVESMSHSVRVGECSSTAAPVLADRGTPRPLAPPSTWFHPEDYPAAAARAHAGGRVGWEIDVDGSGGVTACRIVASSGSAELDAATCGILRLRGRFQAGRPGTYGDHTGWFAPPR